MKLNYSKRVLAEIWNKLNGWEWDDRIGVKPEKWDSMPNSRFTDKHTNPTKKDFISPYMRYIEKKIGIKNCLKWLHVNELGKTNTEFEIWWLKRSLMKVFRIGFYSRKSQKLIKKMLLDIKENNQKDWINKNL
jgi:ribosomal protein L22